jgi:hypothetical protein
MPRTRALPAHPSLGAALVVALSVAAPCAGAQTTIDFENIPAMPNAVGSAVPANAQLSTAFLDQGVSFSSGSPFVAVVTLGTHHATSGVNGIGSVSSSGLLSYTDPIFVNFFNPANSGQIATTDFVSIHADLIPLNQNISMSAFDPFGALITSVTMPDGSALAISAAGIASVQISGTGNTAYDDLQFGPLTPFVTGTTTTPEPSTWMLLGSALALVGVVVRRPRRSATT